MTQQDWKSGNAGDARFGSAAKILSAPVADQGVRNALRDAFSCTKDAPDDFDRLLALLR